MNDFANAQRRRNQVHLPALSFRENDTQQPQLARFLLWGKKPMKKAVKTKGQQIADKARKETNKASDAEREQLMALAVRVIYQDGQSPACVNRR